MAAFTEQQKTEFSMQKWYFRKNSSCDGRNHRSGTCDHKMSGQCRRKSDRIEPDR